MASRPKGYGMTAELADKTASKWNTALAEETMAWVKSELLKNGDIADNRASTINPADTNSDSVHECLKDGVALLQLSIALNMGKPPRINNSKMAFKMMENIGLFLSKCEEAGVQKNDLFQTVDLYEKQNMPQVINGLQALGRKHGRVGPKESTVNKREFTEEQMRSGQNVIGLQMGTNKGASQAGMNFGKSRHILD